MQEKNAVQQTALDKWNEAGRVGTVIATTGVGKTRIGVLAAHSAIQKNQSVLVIVPRTNLRDNEWKNEFLKWADESTLEKVTIECIQTVYKWTDQHFGLVVVDEVHTTLSEKYRMFYENNKFRHLLGLTATLPENDEYRDLLKDLAPVVYSIEVNRSRQIGLVSDFSIYNLKVKLTADERKKYSWANMKFREALMGIDGVMARNANERMPSVMAFANTKLKDRSSPYYRISLDFYRYMGSRKKICYNAQNKLDTCLQIIRKFPERKWIVFSRTVDFTEAVHNYLAANGVNSVRYHSKMSAKERRGALEKANSPFCKVICSAEALNMGFNVPDIDSAICAAGVSTKLVNTQQLGRTIRKKEGKLALYVNLYCENTQEEKWVKKKTDKLKTKWINSVQQILKNKQNLIDEEQ